MKNTSWCAASFCNQMRLLKTTASLSSLIPPVYNYLTNLVSFGVWFLSPAYGMVIPPDTCSRCKVTTMKTLSHCCWMGIPPIKPPPWELKMLAKSIQLQVLFVHALSILLHQLKPINSRIVSKTNMVAQHQFILHLVPNPILLYTNFNTKNHPRSTQHHFATQLFVRPTTEECYLPQPP